MNYSFAGIPTSQSFERFSDDLAAALDRRGYERVVELGGSVIHPGKRWAICRDSEGSPFGLGTPDTRG